MDEKMENIVEAASEVRNEVKKRKASLQAKIIGLVIGSAVLVLIGALIDIKLHGKGIKGAELVGLIRGMIITTIASSIVGVVVS